MAKQKRTSHLEEMGERNEDVIYLCSKLNRTEQDILVFLLSNEALR